MRACRSSSRGFVVAVGLAAAVLLSGRESGGADPRRYAVVDSLFLQRNQAATDGPLVVSAAAPGTAVIATGDLVSTVGTGMRLVYGDHGLDGLGWEAAYVGVWGMDSTRSMGDPAGLLQAAGGLGFAPSGLSGATVARAGEMASLDTAEINLVWHQYDGGFDPAAGRPTRRYAGYDGGHVDWLGGFRWAGFNDRATLSFSQAGTPAPSTYHVDASSNLFAVQGGVRGRIAFERWAFEGWMKAGLSGNVDFQSQAMLDQLAPGDPYRGARFRRLGTMGMLADMNISAVYRFDDVWGLRAGYNLLWLTGLALAPDQFDFSSNAAGGRGLNTTGSVFLAGASLGLEARW